MNLEQFKQLERIKLSYLKHRGNLVLMQEELGLPLPYLKKIVTKIQKMERERRDDVGMWIARTLAQQILSGYEQRVQYLLETLRFLEGKDKVEVSKCCNAPIIDDACQKCGKENPEITVLARSGIIKLRLELLRELREEDKLLTEFAEKMGYTEAPPPPPPPPTTKVNQNIIVLAPDGNTLADKSMAIQLEQLTPLEREALIKKLEKQLLSLAASEERKDERPK